MAMNIQTIGKEMPHGFTGTYARQPDMIVATRPCGAEALPFGTPVKYDSADTTGVRKVVPFGAGAATDFLGIVSYELKSSLNYLDQVGAYAPGEAVSVFQRGCINVICQNGNPKQGDPVYIRTKVNEALPGAVVGGFEAASDTTNSVAIPNCQWAGPKDVNGVAELRILTIQNA